MILALAAVALADDVHLTVLPAAGYDPDDGFGLGLRAELDQLAPGYDPYRTAWMVQGYASVKGYHHHRFRFDATGLGPKHNFRLWGHFAYRQWGNDGYWGLGNSTAVDEGTLNAPLGSVEHDYYHYSLIQPFGRLTLLWDLAPHWGAYGFLSGRWTKVQAREGSLLAAEQPFGMAGGFGAQVGLGVQFDTRVPELTPDGGVMMELAGRYSPPLPDADGHFGGLFASARTYTALGPRVVFGSRLMVDLLWGDVPFYDMNTWGGIWPILGFGGSETLRGISFGRWRGPDKAIWNNELRIDVFEHTVLKKPLRWQLVPFTDYGLTWGAGTGEDDLPYVHPTVGLGIHPIYDTTTAGRFDFATGSEMVRADDGSVRYKATFSAYIVYDQMF